MSAMRHSWCDVHAPSFEAMAEVAIAEIEQLGASVSLVSGPITSGGTGVAEHNLAIFRACVRALLDEEVVLWNQLRYHTCTVALVEEWHAQGNEGYCLPILHRFYRPVFATRRFREAFFIPGWRKSYGSAWERRELLVHGVTLIDLTLADIESFLMRYHERMYVKIVIALLRKRIAT